MHEACFAEAARDREPEGSQMISMIRHAVKDSLRDLVRDSLKSVKAGRPKTDKSRLEIELRQEDLSKDCEPVMG